MNERVKELALQAGLSHMPSNYPDMADLYKGADFELEKFAELIVQECASIVDNNDNSLPHSTFGNLLKAHFEIK